MFQVVVTSLIGLAVAVFGWYYARRTGIEQARQKLAGLQAESIAALERRLNEQERIHRLEIEDLDRRLRACEDRWQRWSTGPVG